MNDEIKEILEDIKRLIEEDETPKNMKKYVGGTFNINELKILLDYITNLQTIEREYSSLLSENAELQQENDRLNNIINETRRILGQYAHYSTPTEEQNAKNEAIVDEAYIQLHGNVAKELKENNNAKD